MIRFPRARARSLWIAPLLLTLGALSLPLHAQSTPADVTDRSVYLLNSRWTTDSGLPVHLRDLRGRYQVLAFIFTHCGGACPQLVKSMQMQARSMPGKARKQIRFLLVTIDPEHDTPKVLRQYRKDMALGENDWTLLRGNEADVRELTATVGFNYARGEGGMFSHSNLITLLSPDGEIVMQHSGGSSDWVAMTQAIAPAQPPANGQ